MKELREKQKRFNFKKYQNAKKSRRMLIRFVVYSVVIAFILYLILESGKPENTNNEDHHIEFFEIEAD